MSNFAEQQTEWILSNILVNGGWEINATPDKNVYFQEARPEHQHLLKSVQTKPVIKDLIMSYIEVTSLRE